MIKLLKKIFGINTSPLEGEIIKAKEESESPRSGFFSTHGRFKKNSKLADYVKEHGLMKTPADFPIIQKSLSKENQLVFTALDSSQVSGMDAAIKTAFALGRSSAPDSLAGWYVSQGFIGYQMCSIISQNWMINKACAVPAQDAARKGWEIKVDDGGNIDPKDLALIRRLDRRKYKLHKNLVQFEKFNRVFGIRIALFKVKSKDKFYYEKPFNLDSVTKGSYEGIVQVDPYWISPELDAEAAADPASMEFYEPTYWRINGKLYHRSHLVITRYGELPDVLKPTYMYGGLPLTQLIYERAYAAERTANEAPMLSMTKRTTAIYVDMEAAMADQKAFEEKMSQWAFYRDNYGIKALGTDERIEQYDTALGDLDNVIMTQYQLVAAIAHMPATKLLETSPKGFNATGEFESESYNETLESIQTDSYLPFLERHYSLMIRSEDLKIEDFDIVFNKLKVMSDKEMAELNESKSRTALNYYNLGAIDGYDARKALSIDKNSEYNGLEMGDDDRGIESEVNETEGEDAIDNNYGYVSVRPQKEDALAIYAAAARAGIADLVDPDELHLTLMYSKNGMQRVERSNQIFVAKPTGEVRVMGEGEYKSIAIIFYSDDLTKRFEELSRLGDHSHDSFVPHISVKYNPTEAEELLVDNLTFDKDFVVLKDERWGNAY